jgi:cytoskeletal protein CcmA (bactofilin family)
MQNGTATIGKIAKRFIFVFISVAFLPSFIYGSEFLTRKTITVSKSDTIADDFYILSNYAKVNGRVEGDLSAFCYDINSTGEIGGNANLCGYRVDLHGRVERSARIFANLANSNGDIAGNMIIIGNEISLGEKAIIGRDLACYGAKITMDGYVKGNLDISGDNAIVSGIIDGDVRITAQKILIAPPAVIKGNLIYTSLKEATIEEGVVIQGEKIWEPPKKEEEKDDEGISIFSIVLKFVLFVMALITGLLFIYLFKEHTRESSKQILENFWVTLARGLLAFIVFTAGVIVLIILILGIPIAVLLIGLGVILFYIGKIYVSISLGRLILKALNREKIYALGWELFCGLIILTVLFQIPFLGWMIYIGAFILGSGAAISGYWALTRRVKAVLQPSP